MRSGLTQTFVDCLHPAAILEAGVSKARKLLSSYQVRYLMTATCSSVLLVGTYGAWLRGGLDYRVANIASQVSTIMIAFPAYRRFVFQSNAPFVQDFMRFLAVWGGGMVGGWVVTPVLVEFFHAPAFQALVASIGMVAVGSFLGHRFFTFSRSRP